MAALLSWAGTVRCVADDEGTGVVERTEPVPAGEPGPSTLRRDLEGRTGVLVVGAEWVPVWRLLRSDLAGEDGVWFADVDADPVGADELGVRTLPTCIVVSAGREQRRVTSSFSADDVRGWAVGVRGAGQAARSGGEDAARDRRRLGAP